MNKFHTIKLSPHQRKLLDYSLTLLGAFVAVVLVTTCIAKPITVDGISMQPTMVDGDFGIANVFAGRFGPIGRFDVVVVFDEDSGNHWLKRVVGLPGERIRYENEILYVNDVATAESFLSPSYMAFMLTIFDQFTADMGEVTLDEGEYFLVGDNRPQSKDSRHVGAFDRNAIVARDVFLLLPLERAGIN